MSGKKRARKRALRRGYTLVELMMALALFTVAVLGIISMQKITVVSNAHAKNVAMAERIAQGWAGQLEMDGSAWRNSAFGAGWLNGDGVWRRPAYITARAFGGAFDALGNPLSNGDVAKAHFCTHVRMSWLYPTDSGVGGNGMLRAEIRVFWLRDGEAALDSNASMCSDGQTDAQAIAIGLATERYHFVYQTVGIRQHPQI
jgi:prepilin-type N-terminal cleavage/methylation domain-containing protein